MFRRLAENIFDQMMLQQKEMHKKYLEEQKNKLENSIDINTAIRIQDRLNRISSYEEGDEEEGKEEQKNEKNEKN